MKYARENQATARRPQEGGVKVVVVVVLLLIVKNICLNANENRENILFMESGRKPASCARDLMMRATRE